MSLQLIKASAGSGKTFRLAQEYLKLLLWKDPMNFNEGYFSQILAITFTNAATTEMKERILHELYTLGFNTDDSAHLSVLLNGNTKENLAKNAQRVMEKILTRYDRFSISTIDKFFQSIVRSIIHEANIPGNFEIELDTGRLTDKAIDIRLARLKEEDPLYYWINLLREEKLHEGGNFKFKREFSALASTLQSKKWYSERSEEDLKDLKEFYYLIHRELKDLEKQGESYLKAVESAFPPGMEFLRKVDNTIREAIFADHYERIRKNATLRTILNDDQDPAEACLGFLTKGNQKKITTSDRGQLKRLYDEVKIYYEWILASERYANTLRILKKTFISFSVLSYLEEAVNEYCRENQILTLQQSNQIVRDKIKGVDTPFIFEKTGQRYKNIFIDEFQDTSKIQFENLIPLLEETLSTGNMNLIVGDIKQSIYRWREGDWRLLYQEVAKKFSSLVKEDQLRYNFRSSKDIVAFNNSFYAYASAQIVRSIEADLAEGHNISGSDFPDIDAIGQVYKDALQIHRKDHTGFVSVHFCPSSDNTMSEEMKKEKALLPYELMRRQIDKCLAAGYRKKDILILFRENKKGREIAEYLLKADTTGDKRYRFTSLESLTISKSAAVSLVISLMTYLSGRDKAVCMAEMVYFSKLIGVNTKIDLGMVSGNDSLRADQKMEEAFFESFPGLKELLYGGQNMTLLEMVTSAIAVFGLDKESGDMEFAYLLKLQDQVLEFTEKNDQNLGNFLDFWKDKGKHVSLNLPENTDAIRLLSIHRSKGLQAPIVIVPFADLDFKGSHKTIIWADWNEEEAAGTPLAGFKKTGPFPIPMNAASEQSFFSNAFISEQILQYLDTLNLYYVATTRAEDRLYLIFDAETGKNDRSRWSLTTGDLLRQFLRNETKCTTEIVEVNALKAEQLVYGTIGEVFPVRDHIPDDGKQYKIKKLHIHQSDFGIKSDWLPERLSSTIHRENEHIERGLLTHELLEEISYVSDLDRVIQKALLDGRITKGEEIQWRSHLGKILNHPEVAPFFAEGLEVINEQGIIVPGEKVQRPDRIVLTKDNTTIIDYKTGTKREKYHRQIQAYAGLLFHMGFPGIKGYILYTDVPEIVQVPLHYQSKFFSE